MGGTEETRRPRWWARRWFKVLVGVTVIGCIAIAVAVEYVLRHAEPIIRHRVEETLSARFNAPVKLDSLSIAVFHGIDVQGSGLRIGRAAVAGDADGPQNPTLLYVQHFSFRTRVRSLLHQPTRIRSVVVDGMEIHVPPRGDRGDLFGGGASGKPGGRIALEVATLHCNNVQLVIETSKPDKDPLEFHIQHLEMQDVGGPQGLRYQAELTNPKPVGQIHAEGHFGPWDSDDPRSTPLDGLYRFDHADLNTIKGLGGMLSSRGQFKGVLDHLTIDGETDTPNFSLDVSEHPVPLHTVFHAYVDGTTGDTRLDPVRAQLLQSAFTARGKVVHVHGKGHDIALDVDVPHARLQDFLRLGVKSSPPLMNAVLTMRTKLHIPPGPDRVAARLQLAGDFDLRDVRFNKPKVQDKVDGLSARAQGKPREVSAYGRDREAEVSSEMSARFSLGHGLMFVRDLRYQIPGALVLLNGVYSMDGNIFEFKGHVRTEATASQMVTGWKSLLLKPVDRFLAKDGAGLQLPIAISGTEGDVRFGLALHGSSGESSSEMVKDLEMRREELGAEARARRQNKEAERQRRKADGSIVGEMDEPAAVTRRRGEGLRHRSARPPE